ncbi:hydrolase [Paraglaciecola chathamensis]|uniref:Hydrolase n=2 Tax=Paraglaciecola chathamensis TaxID=368405 RepID=A0A8H9M434_9ALTE|nr:hydrolase [Paraglaciecola oceanifecundans]
MSTGKDVSKIYLFDWGDTLMVDFPSANGKMHLWQNVETVKGATTTLKQLAQKHDIYIATNAADSNEQDIQQAFERVNLAQYISGYFCFANTGLHKTSADFYQHIIKRLNVEASSITMVGDTFAKDVLPALESGINAVWYNPKHLPQRALNKSLTKNQSFTVINQLEALLP